VPSGGGKQEEQFLVAVVEIDRAVGGNVEDFAGIAARIAGSRSAKDTTVSRLECVQGFVQVLMDYTLEFVLESAMDSSTAAALAVLQ